MSDLRAELELLVEEFAIAESHYMQMIALSQRNGNSRGVVNNACVADAWASAGSLLRTVLERTAVTELTKEKGSVSEPKELRDLERAVIEAAREWYRWRAGYGGLIVAVPESDLFDAINALEEAEN